MVDFSTMNSRQSISRQEVQPTTGSTVTVSDGGNVHLIINPAGTLATLTVTFPSSPSDMDIVTMSSSQIVTALTMSGGTFIGALTTLAVASFARYMYSSTSSKWWRIG